MDSEDLLLERPTVLYVAEVQRLQRR